MAEKLNRPDVIIIGGNHHNPLSVVRSFGVNGIKPYGIIVVGEEENSFVTKSRYWQKTWLVSTDTEAIEFMKSNFGNRAQKPVVITCSDSIAMEIDLRLDELSSDFILPSMGKKKGAVARLMDKKLQAEFADKYGLTMLPSEIAEANMEDILHKAAKVGYPCILKPVASVEGEKLDIKICDNDAEIYQAATDILAKGYTRILVQKYLAKRVEYLLTGAVNTDVKAFTVVSTVRQWPLGIGCGSYSNFVTDDTILEYAERCLMALDESGFSGNCDIEFFQDMTGNVFLNEINWRVSGRNFVSLYTGVHTVVEYYYSVAGIYKCQHIVKKNNRTGCNMNEATDLRHVVAGNISIFKWLSDWKKTKSFALWFSKDPIPAVYRYVYLFCELFKRRGNV